MEERKLLTPIHRYIASFKGCSRELTQKSVSTVQTISGRATVKKSRPPNLNLSHDSKPGYSVIVINSHSVKSPSSIFEATLQPPTRKSRSPVRAKELPKKVPVTLKQLPFSGNNDSASLRVQLRM